MIGVLSADFAADWGWFWGDLSGQIVVALWVA